MERLGEILVHMNACTAEELRAGLQTQAIFGGRIGTNLLELGLVDEAQLAAALTRVHGLPCLTGDVEPEEGAIAAVPAQLAERYGVVPIHADERRLRVVVKDPRDLPSLDDLAFATGKTIEPVLAAEARVWALLRRFYGIDRRLRGIEVADDLEQAANARGAAFPGAPQAAPARPGEGRRALAKRDALALVEEMSDPVVLSALLVRAAGERSGRAIFLKCHGSRAVAWLGAGRRLAGEVRGVDITVDRAEAFGAAAELRAPVLSPIRPSRANASLFGALGAPVPMNGLVAPVVLRGRAVGLLYADAGPGGTLRAADALDLLELCAAVNARLEKVAPLAS